MILGSSTLSGDQSARDTIRKIKSKSWFTTISLMILIAPIHLIADIFRSFYLLKVSFSSCKHLVVISNRNQLKNILKYIPEIQNHYEIMYVKKAKTLATFPLLFLTLAGIFRICFSKQFKLDRLSNLDVSEASYYKNSYYLSMIFKVIKPSFIFMSREDTVPFIETANAIQRLNINLVVVEHGIFVRNYDSFVSTNNTFHVFSSYENASKRNPPALQIIRARNPIQDIYEAYKQSELVTCNDEILIADTYNIRPYLKEICEKVQKSNSVCLRYHPGQEVTEISGVRISHNKIHDLRATKLVITGTSGFALEAAMCGIPTIMSNLLCVI